MSSIDWSNAAPIELQMARQAQRQQARHLLRLQERYDELARFSERQARDLERANEIIRALRKEQAA